MQSLLCKIKKKNHLAPHF